MAALLIPLLWVTAAAQIEIVREGGAGYGCYEVVNGEDVLRSGHATQHKAIQACINLKRENREGVYRVIARERLRIEFKSAGAQEKWVSDNPSSPGQGGDEPPAGWSESLICNTPATDCVSSVHPVTADSHTYTSSPETFEVTSEGGRIIGDEDSFPSWMYTTDTTSDYTITACVRDATQLSNKPDKARTGLMIRDGTAIGDRYHHININGFNGLYLNERFTDDAIQQLTVLDFDPVSLPEGFRMEVDRANDSLKIYSSDDCATYTEQDQEIQTWFGAGNTLYFHLTTAPQDVDNEGLVSQSRSRTRTDTLNR